MGSIYYNIYAQNWALKVSVTTDKDAYIHPEDDFIVLKGEKYRCITTVTETDY